MRSRAARLRLLSAMEKRFTKKIVKDMKKSRQQLEMQVRRTKNAGFVPRNSAIHFRSHTTFKVKPDGHLRPSPFALMNIPQCEWGKRVLFSRSGFAGAAFEDMGTVMESLPEEIFMQVSAFHGCLYFKALFHRPIRDTSLLCEVQACVHVYMCSGLGTRTFVIASHGEVVC